MKPLTKGARELVDEVARLVETGGKIRDNGRDIRNLLVKVSREDADSNLATVESPVALSESELGAVSELVQNVIGHAVKIQAVVRPELLGGLRIRVGDWVLDTSLINQLNDLKSHLI